MWHQDELSSTLLLPALSLVLLHRVVFILRHLVVIAIASLNVAIAVEGVVRPLEDEIVASKAFSCLRPGQIKLLEYPKV